jgi:threonine synthase
MHYDYDGIEEIIRSPEHQMRPFDVWRYKELLPVVDFQEIINLAEGGTSLRKSTRLATRLGCKNVYVKDETRNPTGSFKDRLSTVSITRAVQSRSPIAVIASTGNAAASACAYSSVAGLDCLVLIPSETSYEKLSQILMFGGRVLPVKGNVEDCIKLSCQASKEYLILNLTTASNINPFSVEGAKTIAYEICEQLEDGPSHVIVPLGGGGNLSAQWLGFNDFYQFDLIKRLPKMVAIQSEGCSPFVDAFKRNGEIRICKSPHTIASAIKVPHPSDADAALKALKDSKGYAETVTDEEILEAERFLARTEGIFAEPAAAAPVAGLKRLLASGVIDKDDTIVCVVTGTGLKYPEVVSRIVQIRKREMCSGYGDLRKILSDQQLHLKRRSEPL